MKKVCLFVDGSNLYGGQYELFGPKNYLSFKKLIVQIEKSLEIKFSKIFFYASFSPASSKLNKKNQEYIKNESFFYKNVKEIKNLNFFKGYRSKTSGKEKEVDVKLAVDIVNFAHLDKYDELYLFSGDADFMHALEVAKSRGKKINILALENRIPNRFAYFYKTFVFNFGKTSKNYKSDKQKIKEFFLNKNRVIESVK